MVKVTIDGHEGTWDISAEDLCFFLGMQDELTGVVKALGKYAPTMYRDTPVQRALDDARIRHVSALKERAQKVFGNPFMWGVRMVKEDVK